MSDMGNDNQFAEFRATFFDECDELLDGVDTTLSQLNNAAIVSSKQGVDILNSVFRAVHTINVGAAAFGFVDLMEFTHLFEEVLEKARHGEIQIDENAVRVFVTGIDLFAKLVEAAKVANVTEGLLSDYGNLTDEIRGLIVVDDNAKEQVAENAAPEKKQRQKKNATPEKKPKAEPPAEIVVPENAKHFEILFTPHNESQIQHPSA
jgi:chemotaxis protein histidine kinase CheA